jgi:arginine exporter protein ArgO
VSGILAGYGVAVPVGAVAVLIVETGIRRGFPSAAAAGAGAATADLIYSAFAVVGGSAIAAAIESIERPIRLASAAVLLGVGLAGMVRVLRQPGPPSVAPPQTRLGLLRTYRTFVGITIVNPLTLVYFAVIVLGSGLAADLTAGQGAGFVLAAFAASLSWQTLLAGVGGLAHHALPGRFRVGASVTGSLVVIAMAVIVAVG